MRGWYLANLDHLCRPAKDLLAVLRRAQPSATLADAKVSVARDYGSGRWTQLEAAPPDSAAPGERAPGRACWRPPSAPIEPAAYVHPAQGTG